MHHGREDSGRLGFGDHLTRRHSLPSPSPSDAATSPLMPPPPRDAARFRSPPPPPPSRPTPPRRTGCHRLRPVVKLQALLGLSMLIGLIYKSVIMTRVRVLKTIVRKEDQCLLEEMDLFRVDKMVALLMLVITAIFFYRVSKINQRNTHYDTPNHQGGCRSQGSLDPRLSEFYQWKEGIYEVNRDVGSISAQVSKDIGALHLEVLSLKHRMNDVLGEDDSIVPRFLRFWG